MDTEKFLAVAKKLDSKKRGKMEEREKFKKLFERFHLINRAYVDKEAFDKAQGSISSMAEAMVNTIQYIDGEIVRIRNKGRKQPFEVVELAELQKVQKRNEMLLREFEGRHL